jgi:hypothetical protein
MPHDLHTLDHLTHGYVLNLYAGIRGRAGNTIHPWNCPHIRRMTLSTRKIWGASVIELEEWLAAHGGEFDPNVPKCGYVQE